jgi:MFS family permease
LNRSWRSRSGAALVSSYFLLFGILLGAQGVVWPEIFASLRVSEGAFGTAQLVSPAVAIVLLLLGGFWSETLGLRRLLLASVILLATSCCFLAAASRMGIFIIALLLAGCGNGLLETSMNAATIDLERATGKLRMNLMHAGFSAGAIAGALSAGAALSRGFAFGAILLSLLFPCAIVLAGTITVALPPPHPHSDEPHPLSTIRLILRDRNLRRLALLSAVGVIGESVAFVWAVIYLNHLGAAPLIGGVGFALFNGAMLLGRIVNAPLVARAGFRVSLILSGATLTGAAMLLVGSSNVALATLGFALTGFGVAGVIPTVLGQAAALAPGTSGAISGGIMAAAYVGFVICPPAVGWLAQVTSLRAALGVVAASGVAIVLLSWGMPRSTHKMQESR